MIELADLLTSTGGVTFGPVFAQRFVSFSYDSRLLATRPDPGDDRPAAIFVAVKTEKGDGHDFVQDAVARGATGVLCQREMDLSSYGVTCVVVPDTRLALTSYAHHVFSRPSLTSVCITGSAGKTTAKELIAAVLARGPRRVFRNQGSINGRYGLSIAAGEMTPDDQLAVLELAADSYDEIRDLAALTRPHVGVVTSIGEAHLATFGSLAAIAREKGHLLEALPPDGLAILNGDDPLTAVLAERTSAVVVTVGENPAAHLQARNVTVSTQGVAFDLVDNGFSARLQRYDFQLPRMVVASLLGRHHVPLLLAAVAVGAWFGIPARDTVAALADVEPQPGHLRPLPARHYALILDDTVNASPAAVSAALDVLALFGNRPRIAVLGDMWELGYREVDAHRRAGEQAARVADWLVVKGQRAQQIAVGALEAGMPRSQVFQAFTDADVLRHLDFLLASLNPQDGASGIEGHRSHPPVVLVKGDRPARMERIVAGLMATPQFAADLLVRQSPGWLQVQPLLQDRPTWVDIDLEAVAGNVRAALEIVGPEAALCAVLKADGYGHGAVGVGRTALNNGARMLAVACLAEAVTLRRAGIDAPIMILGYTPAWQARDTLRYDVTATVYDIDVARAFSQAAADLHHPARLHVKVDTGMGRLGLRPEDAVSFVRQLNTLPGVDVEGIFSHFSVADSDDPAHQTHSDVQLAAFESILAQLRAAGLLPPLVHMANSAATLSRPTSHFNMVRLGVALYGLQPSTAVPLPPAFRPALSWKTQVAQVKTLPPGAPVSYGNTFHTGRETRLAVIPVGYADGFRRSPQHWGQVLVRGRWAPIVGRVTMDQTMLDVTDIPGVRQGDEVVLIGRQGELELTADQVAERLGTISYEVVSQILARVPRVV
ncbi:MAG: alanine racemase [Anaerolineae bacterium]|nr:alanine racemase [Anaerolineae bacterium]MCB0248086.1 alanine racemase [Anaerolineae bacterium]